MSLERGRLLYEQSRYDLAETELRHALAANPHDAFAHALLALCLVERKQVKDATRDATEEARQAVHLAPDFPFAHYALAKVWYERDHYDEARKSAEEAIRLDPSDPDYRFLLGAIHFDERRFQDALRLAEEGLELDPEHVGGNNLRALALVKLGRTREAGATIDAALARDPENSATHANRGWTLLEQGRVNEAQDHFRESLRLDADNEWARKGIVEALKARNPLYAGMLRYFLWMSRLSRGAQWGVIVGGFLINRMLTNAARANPDVAPWVLPFRILYIAFVLLTWTADPLFNLVLRLNRFGRLALSREQIVESNWLGTIILLALLSLGACFVWGFDSPFLLSAVVFGFLIIPVAGTFKTQLGWPRTAMWVYTGVLAALGLTSLAMALASEAQQDGDRRWGAYFGLFLVGVVLAPWVANYMISRRPRR